MFHSHLVLFSLYPISPSLWDKFSSARCKSNSELKRATFIFIFPLLVSPIFHLEIYQITCSIKWYECRIIPETGVSPFLKQFGLLMCPNVCLVGEGKFNAVACYTTVTKNFSRLYNTVFPFFPLASLQRCGIHLKIYLATKARPIKQGSAVSV